MRMKTQNERETLKEEREQRMKRYDMER